MKEIVLNEYVKNRLVALIEEKRLIEARLSEDMNLVVQANGLGAEGARYTLTSDLAKIVVTYPSDEQSIPKE